MDSCAHAHWIASGDIRYAECPLPMGFLPKMQGQAKPDMVAFSRLRKELTPPDTHGHVPGVSVGDTFSGRGELAILGLHTQILRGIWRCDWHAWQIRTG